MQTNSGFDKNNVHDPLNRVQQTRRKVGVTNNPTNSVCRTLDQTSGKNNDRPDLAMMFDYIRPGDVLVVVSLDRLGRPLEDRIVIVGRLNRQGVGFHSLYEKLDTTTPAWMLIFHVFAALAEFVRTIIVANTNDGLAAARAAGQRLGSPPAMTPEKLAYARQLLAEPERTVSSIAKLVGVSRSTLYKALPDLLPAELAGQRVAAQVADLPADNRPPSAIAPHDELLTNRAVLDEPVILGGHG